MDRLPDFLGGLKRLADRLHARPEGAPCSGNRVDRAEAEGRLQADRGESGSRRRIAEQMAPGRLNAFLAEEIRG
jgi:hypothetical protein